ncbi:beta-galactosidase [Amycolatopsis balhimycina DSM 5908]|uniref:beta-galactosidase n=1 Tax=Amycolatopsis balhimycina DSM 5908 TaxID=1081091 RepID=A0A428VZT2_AMYBA|nr:beta-galactosidase [Amycolatopsis balhimycina]RSM36340.1 beta-galactosidase [Amycolatopsis balhimycina DSM 5908]
MRRRLLTLALALATAAGLSSAPVAEAAPHAQHQVTFDKYSLMLDGQRQFVWSGEFHPFRLPSPDLWRDVLQKMKATGYNAVSIYFDWNYHSPAPGVYDFTGVRDMDRVLDLAAEAGLYVIARPGPYINAEVTGGGFPGWLATQQGKARSDAPDYLAAADEWLTAIDRIIARHQYTDGRGPVILYQIENELAATGVSQQNYIAHLYDKVRADGIGVPIFHNDKGRNGIWVPPDSGVPGTVPGKVDLYAWDTYPAGTCRPDATPGAPSNAPDWGLYGPGGAKGGASASPNTPGFTAEFGGGWFDYWGSNGTYPCTAVRQGPGYERVFYGTNIANGLTIQNFYMTFGGTSWGWLPAPVVYSSYDYGAAIDEGRQLRPKALTMKELGYFLQAVPPITKQDKADPITPSSAAVKVYHNVNPDTKTHFYLPVHNPPKATTDDAFTFPLSTADGSYTVPQAGTLRLNGQDAKHLVANFDLAGQHLVYSTSEITTSVAGTVLLNGRPGEDGETTLRYATQPRVDVLSGAATSTWDAANGDLRLNYVHNGLARVRISGGGRAPVTLLLADDATADTFWRQDTAAGPVLVRGPAILRTARSIGPFLALTGDTARASDLEVWGPAAVVSWNGRPVPARRTTSSSLLATAQLLGPAAVELPLLTGWKQAPGSPESAVAYDDRGWPSADKTTTASTTKPPAGQPVLTADDYGFHTGDVWYRGHANGPVPAELTLTYGGGGAGMLQAWLDGRYLGQHVLPSALASPPTTGTATFAVPEELRGEGEHVLSVMVRDNGHNEDGGVNDAHKEGRGLISSSLTGVAWKIRGGVADPVRGPLNNGGLDGERAGWSLPGYPDARWAAGQVPAATAAPGTTWYRTNFTLNVPKGQDASLGLTIGDPATPRSGGRYRALLFVNGWNLGQYLADVGPQHTFALPNGVLNPNGRNTLALAVTSDGGPGNGLETVALTDLGTVRGGVPVRLVGSPGYRH